MQRHMLATRVILGIFRTLSPPHSRKWESQFQIGFFNFLYPSWLRLFRRGDNVSSPVFNFFFFQAIIDEFEQKLRACHTRGMDGIEELETGQGGSQRAPSAKKPSNGMRGRPSWGAYKQSPPSFLCGLGLVLKSCLPAFSSLKATASDFCRLRQ